MFIFGFFFFKGGRVGNTKAGAGHICQQACGDLQRWEQAQTLHCYGLDWLSSGDLSGEIELHWNIRELP